MSVDREYRIRITTEADTAPIRNTGEALKEAGEHAEKFGLKGGELKKLVRELGHEFPLAGMAARAFLNPLVFGITSAIGVFAYFKKHLDEVNAALDETAKRNAGREFLPGIDAKAAALESAAAAARAFQLSLTQIKDAEDKFNVSISHSIDKLHEFQAAQAELDDAQKAKELSQVNLDEKTGKLTPGQAITARGAITEKYRRLGDERKTQAENEELALKEEQLRNAKEQQDKLAEDAAMRRALADQAAARVKYAQANLPGAKQLFSQYDTEYDKAVAQREDAEKWYKRAEKQARLMGLSELPEGQADRKRLEKAKEEEATALLARERQRRLVQTYQGDITNLSVYGIPQLNQDAKTAESRASANAGLIGSLETETGNLRNALPARQFGRAAAGMVRDQATETDTAAQLAAEAERLKSELKSQNERANRSANDLTQEMVNQLIETQRKYDDLRKYLGDALKRLNNGGSVPPQ